MTSIFFVLFALGPLFHLTFKVCRKAPKDTSQSIRFTFTYKVISVFVPKGLPHLLSCLLAAACVGGDRRGGTFCPLQRGGWDQWKLLTCCKYVLSGALTAGSTKIISFFFGRLILKINYLPIIFAGPVTRDKGKLACGKFIRCLSFR